MYTQTNIKNKFQQFKIDYLKSALQLCISLSLKLFFVFVFKQTYEICTGIVIT